MWYWLWLSYDELVQNLKKKKPEQLVTDYVFNLHNWYLELKNSKSQKNGRETQLNSKLYFIFRYEKKYIIKKNPEKHIQVPTVSIMKVST